MARPTPKRPTASNGKGNQRKAAATGTEVRSVRYPTLTINGVEIPLTALRISRARARELLGWETEKDFTVRKLQENPRLKPDSPTATFGEDYLLTVGTGKDTQKVRCWNNLRNRPLTMSTAEGYAQDILNRNWAGYTTMGGKTLTLPLHDDLSGGTQEFPEATINGEAIIIGRTGQVESGQHRLIGLELACQQWDTNQRWRENWPEEPYIESVLVCGVSEAQQVVRTLDNVRPRGLDDVLYTSDLFSAYGPEQKKQLSRMMKNQVNLLWTRLEAGKNDKAHEHQTHSESLDFIQRHGGGKGKLMQALKAVYKLRGDERTDPFNAQKVYAGDAAALLWLMACGLSEEADYYHLDPPGDRKLDWSRWAPAEAFWASFATKADDVRAVCEAIATLVSEGGGSHKAEKLYLLAKGWAAYLGDGEVAPSDLDLTDQYVWNEQKAEMEFVGTASFGGIDRGAGKPPPPPADLESAKAEVRAEHAAQIEAGAEGANGETDKPSTSRPRAKRAVGEVTPPEPMGADGNPPLPKARPRPKVKAVGEAATSVDEEDNAPQTDAE